MNSRRSRLVDVGGVNTGATEPDESGRRSVQARLKEWTRELLGLGEDSALTVSELSCADPGCPDLETVIGISVEPGQWRRLRIRKPAAEVTRSDLETLIR